MVSTLSSTRHHDHSILAAIDPRAKIAPGVVIGPFCVIGPDVRIGAGTQLESHVTLAGDVTLGCHNHIFEGAVIGETHSPDGKLEGAKVVIGDHNDIRECVTIGADTSHAITSIGNHNLVMACCRLTAGCRIDNHISIANGSIIGRGAQINDHASLSGRVIVQDFVKIGSYSFTGIASLVVEDVPPFVIVEGTPSRPRALNLVGLNRNGFSQEAIQSLGSAYRLVFRAKLDVKEARAVLAMACTHDSRVRELFQFMEVHDVNGGRPCAAKPE